MNTQFDTYWQQCRAALGQAAHDPQAVARWCWEQAQITKELQARLVGAIEDLIESPDAPQVRRALSVIGEAKGAP